MASRAHVYMAAVYFSLLASYLAVLAVRGYLQLAAGMRGGDGGMCLLCRDPFSAAPGQREATRRANLLGGALGKRG